MSTKQQLETIATDTLDTVTGAIITARFLERHPVFAANHPGIVCRVENRLERRAARLANRFG